MCSLVSPNIFVIFVEVKYLCKTTSYKGGEIFESLLIAAILNADSVIENLCNKKNKKSKSVHEQGNFLAFTAREDIRYKVRKL